MIKLKVLGSATACGKKSYKAFVGPEETVCISLMTLLNILLEGHALILFTAQTEDCFSKP